MVALFFHQARPCCACPCVTRQQPLPSSPFWPTAPAPAPVGRRSPPTCQAARLSRPCAGQRGALPRLPVCQGGVQLPQVLAPGRSLHHRAPLAGACMRAPWPVCATSVRKLSADLAGEQVTPLGVGIGIGVATTWNTESKAALGAEGVFDAVSAGILIYNGLADLILPTFAEVGLHMLVGGVCGPRISQLSAFQTRPALGASLRIGLSKPG